MLNQCNEQKNNTNMRCCCCCCPQTQQTEEAPLSMWDKPHTRPGTVLVWKDKLFLNATHFYTVMPWKTDLKIDQKTDRTHIKVCYLITNRKAKHASGILISLKKTNNNNSVSHQFLEVFNSFYHSGNPHSIVLFLCILSILSLSAAPLGHPQGSTIQTGSPRAATTRRQKEFIMCSFKRRHK